MQTNYRLFENLKKTEWSVHLLTVKKNKKKTIFKSLKKIKKNKQVLYLLQ